MQTWLPISVLLICFWMASGCYWWSRRQRLNGAQPRLRDAPGPVRQSSPTPARPELAPASTAVTLQPNAIEAALGGPEALCRLLGTEPQTTIERRLKAAGIPYHAPDAEPRPPCVKLLPLEYRGITRILSAYHLVDELGRPVGGLIRLPHRYQTNERDEAAQLTVGRWGDRSGVDCDGGHLVMHAVGGTGSRINLIPKAKDLNRGPWADGEDRAKELGRQLRRSGGVVYYARAIYPDARSVIPSHVVQHVYHVGARKLEALVFANANRSARAA